MEDILVHTEASGDGSAPISPPWSSDQLSMRGSHLHHALSSQSSDFRCSPSPLPAADSFVHWVQKQVPEAGMSPRPSCWF